jgi:hypothetical protein
MRAFPGRSWPDDGEAGYELAPYDVDILRRALALGISVLQVKRPGSIELVEMRRLMEIACSPWHQRCHLVEAYNTIAGHIRPEATLARDLRSALVDLTLANAIDRLDDEIG